MALVGSDYLLRLAAIAVSFVGFASVIVALRQSLGSQLSPIHMHLVRFFIEGGLSVAAFSLLPGALSYTSLPDLASWRLSSVVAAVVYSGYFFILFRRRRRLAPHRLQFRTVLAFPISSIGALGLWTNAIAPGFQPGPALYVLALTWLLMVGGWLYIQNLDIFFGPLAPEPSPVSA